MEIITISGKARFGKDYSAEYMKTQLESMGYKVVIAHFADLLKYIAKQFYGWDGVKDEKGRTLLQVLGTEKVRNTAPNYWVDFIVSIAKMMPDLCDYMLIPDSRFPNENDILKDEFGEHVSTVRIIRPGFDNGLTEEQKNHSSETALDNYNFDYYVENDGTANFNEELDALIEGILECR